MPNVKVLQRSFGGGEVTPEFFGRTDDAKYASGVALMRNMIALPHGPAQNRAGFAYVREVKDSTKKVRLVPFTYSTTQTMVIEMGAGYFRFHTQGATLLYDPPADWATSTAYTIGALVANEGGNYYCTTAHTSGTFATDLAAGKWYALPDTPNIYEIPNPYAEADLMDIHFVQSSDVLTFVHQNYAPRELRRYGATDWRLTTISFAAPLAAPTAPTVACTGQTADKYTYKYVVTAVDDDGNESVASASGEDGGNLYETGCIATITWTAVTGATRYRVYKLSGGLYGYIGESASLSIIDNDITADVSQTPPIYEDVFSSANNYPGAVSYFEQRRCFAGTINKPQNLWMTKSGTESSLSYSLPVRDDDRIAFRVAAREANTIRHIVPLSNLLLFTSSAEWRITSVNSDAITPSTVNVKPQSYIGASNVQPAIINNNVIYCAARGGHVREMAYSWQGGGYVTGDLSLRAPHLFDNKTIVDMAYAKSPQPIVWFVNSDGLLLGLTYVPEQQIGAWHWHDTDGQFESVCVVSEGNDDVLYAVVKRTVNGATVRYVERMASRLFAEQEDAFFVDSGATYDGVPADEITGLTWLEGKTVSILADGAVHPQRVVTGGAVVLDYEAGKVHIGLPITADLQTLPVAVQIDNAFGQGRFKNVNKGWIRVHRSSGVWMGPNSDMLVEAKQRKSEPYGKPPALVSEEIPIMIKPSWGDSGQVFIRQVDPLPLTVVSVALEIATGG